MTSPRVKICGITRVEDGIAAVDAGADFIGVVFAERVRRVAPAEAASVVRAVHGRARGVGVFVDADEGELVGHHDVVGFEVAQLHGSESPESCGRLRARGLEVWKAIRPRTRAELADGFERFGDVVDAILVEGFSSAAAGGTGSAFPHEWLQGVDRASIPTLVLAGGLTPANVRDAVSAVGPDVVDVSSGVESAPGVKSIAKIQSFIDAARGRAVREAP